MKKFAFFALPLLAVGFASCSDDKDEPVAPAVPATEYEVITFSDCEFPTGKNTNVTTGGGNYTELGGLFQFAEKYTMVSGCVVSDLKVVSDDKDSRPKDFAVALNPSENDDNKFAVVSKYSYLTTEDAEPSFSFENGAEREIASIDVMNSTEMHQYMTIGYYSYAPMTDGDWCKATFTGFDAAGTETGSVEVYLADFRNGASNVMSDWTTVDMKALGKVNKVMVNLTWSESWDKPSSSNYTVCVDNIKMVKE
ncbi:MAG: DUF4465 domain-containing protein [Paramuribaculum sp.]|nr:DUF4465 domain-containing protein [Paramuribaculum sp.]